MSVTFETSAHAQPGHFNVPLQVALELGSGDGQAIRLRVESARGLLFEGRVELASGTEVYPRRDDPKSGLRSIRPHERLFVTAYADLDRPGDHGMIVRAESVESLVYRRVGYRDDPWDLALVQRDRLWDDVRISRLLDSLLAGYPIGSILLCEVEDAPERVLDPDSRRLKSATGPQLLDGQQRINALAALFGELEGFGVFYLHMTKGRPREEMATRRRTKVNVTDYIVHRDGDQDEAWRPIRERELHLRLSGFARFALEHRDALAHAEGALERGLAEGGDPDDLSRGLGGLREIDDRFIVPAEDGRRRLAAQRALALVRAWRSPVPVEQRRLRDMVDVLQVFERVNLEGVRVAGEDVFFAAVKMRLPDAEELCDRMRQAAPFLPRRGALRLAARLGSLAAGQGDLLPLRVERLNGPRGELLRSAIERVLDPDAPATRRIGPLARRLMQPEVLGHALEYVSAPLLDHVFGWAAVSRRLDGATDAELDAYAHELASYLVGATAFDYWPIFEESFSVPAMDSAIRAGLQGQRFPAQEIRRRIAGRWSELSRRRRQVRSVVFEAGGVPDRQSALAMANASGSLFLALAQGLPYELPERSAGPDGVPTGRRQVEWDHIWPQARADRFRHHRRLADGARAIWRTGNLWALDRPLNTSAGARLPREKFDLLASLPAGGLPSRWPQAEQAFLTEAQIEAYLEIEKDLGAHSGDPTAVERAAERLAHLVDERGTEIGLAVLSRFPSIAAFGRAATETSGGGDELEGLEPPRAEEIRAALRVELPALAPVASQTVTRG
jgi:hypothetical protein